MPARLLVVVLALAALLFGAARANACSCLARDPRSALEGADAAFIGRLIATRPVSPRKGPFRSSFEPTVFTFRVEEVVKGTLARRVDVRSAATSASCGVGAEVGDRVALLLDRHGGRWRSDVCSQMTPRVLRAAATPLAAAVEGNAFLLAGGRFGDGVRTIALDRRGRAVAYGRGPGATWDISSCPGGRVAVEVASDRRRTWAAARELPTLRRLWQVPIVRGSVVSCRDAHGRDVIVFSRAGGDRTIPSLILRVGRRGVTPIHGGRAVAVSFSGDRTAYTVGGRSGRGLFRIDLRTGRARIVAQLPPGTGAISVSPGGRWLAGVGSRYPARSRVVLVDLAARTLRTVPLRQSNVFGETLWLDRRRFAFVPSGGDSDDARVYDTRLRVLDEFDLDASDVVRAGNVLYGLGGGKVLQFSLPRGRAGTLRRFLSPETHALAAVRRESPFQG